LGIAVAEGMSHACLRLVSGKATVRRSKQMAEPALQVGIDCGPLPDDGRDRLPGQVVGRGAQATGGDDEIDRAQASRSASTTAAIRSGSAAIQAISTPCRDSDRARSPLFVSRVSPTVSSLPMASSAAVLSERPSGEADSLFCCRDSDIPRA